MARFNARDDSLPNRLRRMIEDSGKSHYALGKAAGVGIPARSIDSTPASAT